MKFEKYIKDNQLNEGFFSKGDFIKILSSLKKFKPEEIKKRAKESWDNLILTLKPKEEEILKIVNKTFGTRWNNLEQIGKERIKESSELNEDWKHYWELLKNEGFPTLAFYPALTAWLEIGKLLDPDVAVNWKKFGVYAVFWLMLVSGKFLKGFLDWKKNNPEEWKKEGAKKNPFAVK